MQSVSDWQHPFVDVFKKYNTYEAPKSFKGNVSIIHDPIIARKCFKLSGSILSNNTITIPDPNSELKHCNLTGRYIYIEFLAAPQKFFSMHFEIGIKDRQPGVRFTFTNMEKQYIISGGNTLKIPFNPERNLWTVACIDIEHHLQNFGLFSKGVIKNYAGIHTVRGIQLCSNITVRGVYTSSNIYDWDSLPKQMCFKLVKGGRWSQFYNFIYLPSDIDPAQMRKKMKAQQPVREFPQNIVEMDQTTNKKRKQPLYSFNQSSQIVNKVVAPLPSDQFLELDTAFSFSSLHNPDLLFKNDSIYYSAGAILIQKDIKTGKQHFMQGHTDYIVAMDSDEDWIVTVQQGVKTGVRIWIDNKCISSFQCPYEKVQQIRLNNKKHLAMVGLDPYKRQAILIFDINQIQITRKPILLAKQISDFNILTIKFSPIETDKLVSCGKENIRFWRVKNQHLPGAPVILNHHARNTIFTVFDFEYSFDDPNPIKQKNQIKRVYVGSQNGLLFQVNYQTHQLEQVYKLHDNAAISSIVVSSGFCITGGADQLLRVWQMDFNQFILEAKNDGVVTSLVLSQDASLVACGTSTGSLSILDLSSNNYNTIVRSHTQSVNKIVYHTFSNCLITLSNDLTIRLWDPQRMEQTYEFSYPNNDPCTCLSGNPQSLFFAAGFESGILRIFDIENTCVLEEIKHHDHPIIHIQYSPDGRFLAVIQQIISMLYSPLHSHQPIKHLPVEINSKYKHSCFSQDSQRIAMIGDSGTHINIWELRGLQMIGKIFTGKIIKKLKYQGDCIWALFQDTSIRRYNTIKMTIQVEMQALHRQALNGIDFDLQNHLLFTVGNDSFVKVWDYSFMRQPHQVYIGHANEINDVVFVNGKLWTIGSQGILVWNFKPSKQVFVPPPIFSRQKKAQFIKNSAITDNKNREQNRQLLQQSKQQLGMQQFNVDHQQMIETTKPKSPAKENKIMFSNLLKKAGGNPQAQDKFVPKRIEMGFVPKLTSFRKIKKRQPKAKLTANLPEINVKHSLPLKHFFQQQMIPTQLPYSQKIEMIKQNNKKYKLQYFVGIEPHAHDHIVWNFMYGWYAYICDNLIIVESLNKNRSQKIITMPQKIGSLSLSVDYKKLLCSSQFNPIKKEKMDLQSSDEVSQISSQSGGDATENAVANIYILAGDFTIEKKLQFHPKGIQSFKISSNGKYLISIGNFRQCTVCLWDLQTGKLKASSYTLDKLNDIAIMENCGESRLLEFVTVGRDQIHFWAFSKQQTLQYYDVFIKKEQGEDEVPEISACDYIYYDDMPYLMCGTTKGELILVRYGDFQVTWKRSICSSQITSIKSYANRAILGSHDGNVYFWNYNATILQSQPSPNFQKLNLYYSVTGLHFDPDGTQGVVATSEAVYYVNLNDQFSTLLVGSCPDRVIMMKSISPQYYLTSHANGRLKLWNIDTAQQLKTYKWKYPCTQAYFDDSFGKIICFGQNQSVKIVNIKKFTKEENYMPQDIPKTNDPKLDDYVIYTTLVSFGGKPSRWVFFKKGNVFTFQLGQQGRKKVIKMNKVLQIGSTLNDVQAYSDKNLLLAVTQTGTINSFNVDVSPNGTYSLLMVDQAQYEEFFIEARNNKILREDLHDQKKKVKVAVSKILNQTYLCISEDSQYLYFRNYMKRLTFQRIMLGGIPASILLHETRKQSEAVLGMKQGGIVTINAIDPDQRSRYDGIINQQLDNLQIIKSKNWLVATSSNSLAFYSRQ